MERLRSHFNIKPLYFTFTLTFSQVYSEFAVHLYEFSVEIYHFGEIWASSSLAGEKYKQETVELPFLYS